MSDWKRGIEDEWKRRAGAQPHASEKFSFPLIGQSVDVTEVLAMIDTLLSGRITMADRVREYEAEFAKATGAQYAAMVNSGSSANLLALAAAANPARKPHLKPGDEVLVPAICWSTSVWPILQVGAKPVFVDVDPKTLNVDISELRGKLTPKTKGMVAVHILGNSAPMAELLAFAKEANLILVEDTCESLGSKAQGKQLGTFADFGTYSFYYSHHITTGEGGMVVCKTLEDYDLLRCLRAHGWTRELSNRAQVDARHSDVDSRFLFVNLGYNLRPMETQAAMGLVQLRRMGQMNEARVKNHDNLRKALRTHPGWREQLIFPEAAPGTDPVWFGFPCLLNSSFSKHHRAYLEHLSNHGVENRPVISGNFTRQPALKLLGIQAQPELFPGAELVHQSGFFIGLHTDELPQSTLQTLANVLLSFSFA